MAHLRNLIACARNRLVEKLAYDQTEARIEVRALLAHALGDVSHAWLIAHEEDLIQPDVRDRFESLLARRIDGEPIAYITGKREFFGLDLKVTPDTLIPRPDTETLVEAALAKIPEDKKFNVLDLGTGTGAIALAIAINRPISQITAVDRSEKALAIAKQNGTTLNVSNTRFLLSNWFSSINDERFDIIVSNPPYIEATDPHLHQGDLRFEPLSALASGIDGLDDIRKIIETSKQFLNADGWLMLEHGYNQADQVSALLSIAGFQDIYSTKDLAGILRVTSGCLK
ncbi:MAG: peptide chain release factor N(5)-glutamine methyltransferase [Methylophilaceae bacterium]